MKRPMPYFSIHMGGDFSQAQLVPASPTPKMLEAACKALDGVDLSKYGRKDKAQIKMAVRWAAMLKAAPKLEPVGNWFRPVASVDRGTAK